MKKADIYQIIGIGIVILIFIWENRKAEDVNKIFLWIIFGVILISFLILNGYSFLKSKFDVVDQNNIEILKLKE